MSRCRTEDVRVLACMHVQVHRGWRRTREQTPGRPADALVAVGRHDERRHDFASMTSHTDCETAQGSELAVGRPQICRGECVACRERECIAAFIVYGTFDDWNHAA